MSREPEEESNPFAENSNQNQPANSPRLPVPPPAGLSDQNYRENPPSEEGLAAGDAEGGTAKREEEYKESDDLRQENENPQAVRTEYLFLPPATVDPVKPAASKEIENPVLQLSTLSPSSVADTVLSLRPPGAAVETEHNSRPTSVAPPAQSSLPGASHRDASTSKNQDKRKRPAKDEAALFRCRFCPRIFSTPTALGGHMGVHGRERQAEQLPQSKRKIYLRKDVYLFHNEHAEKRDEQLHSFVFMEMHSHNIGSPSQIQPQFAGTPTTSPWSLESQFTAQGGPYHHNLPPLTRNLGHPGGNSYADINAPGYGKPEALPPINIQNWPLRANSTGWNRPDMVPTTSTRTQDPQPHHQPHLIHSDPDSGFGASMQRNYPYPFGQSMASSSSSAVAVTQGGFYADYPHSFGQSMASSSSSVAVTQGGFYPSFERHQQPQLMHSDTNIGVRASMQINYPYSLGQGMASSSSSLVAVTQGGFNRSFDSHHQPQLMHSDPNSGVGTSMQNIASSLSSALAVRQGEVTPSFQRHHQPQFMHSDPNLGVGASMQINCAYMPSSSSLVTVTQGGFNRSFDSHHQPQLMHSDPNSGVGTSMQNIVSSLSSAVAVSQGEVTPNFQRHHQPQFMHSDPNLGVGASMQINCAYMPSSSSLVAVTQGGFNRSFDSHHQPQLMHSDPNSGVGTSMQNIASSLSSALAVSPGEVTPSFQRHHQPQFMHSDPNLGVGASMQINCAYMPSSSSLVAVTHGGFNRSFDSHHQPQLMHSDPNSGVGTSMQNIASFLSSALAVSQGEVTPSFQRHHQPQFMHSDPNLGVGASMQINCAYMPSSSSLVAVTRGGFNRSFDSHHQPQLMHSDPNSGVGTSMQNIASSLSSALAVRQGEVTPSFQRHHQPQFMHSDPNLGVGASMQINCAYMPSSSSLVAVTQGGFNRSFDSHHQPQLLHSDPNSGVEASMQRNYPSSFGHGVASSPSSHVAITQEAFIPSFEHQKPRPTISSIVHQRSTLANVSGTLRGLTPASQFQAAPRSNSLEDINVHRREVINVESSSSSHDNDRNSNHRH